ncbi:MAG: SMC-Scp complex subunit ScpB [Clostridia bacterium]|nr:SMC-Scp complex subunit ScpB [Clostridia bacterium]
MEIEKAKAIIEAILFACGREVKVNELMSALELSGEDVLNIVESLKADYKMNNRGIEIIRVNDGFQLTTKKEYYEYIYPIFDKRSKPNLTNAALETLSIVAYNPKITRPEIEMVRGVNSDGTMYKLLEYNLIEAVGKADAPGRPTMYEVTPDFYRMFGFSNMEELPELPRYKLDENQQIVIDEIIEDKEQEEIQETENKKAEENVTQENNTKEPKEMKSEQSSEELNEAPMPEREAKKNNE